MKKLILSFSLILLCGLMLKAETIVEGKKASEIYEGAVLVRYKDNVTNPTFIRFDKNSGPLLSEAAGWISENFDLKGEFSLEYKREDEDIHGYTHVNFVQKYNGIKVEFASVTAHARNGRIETISGYTISEEPAAAHAIDENTSLQNALSFVNASVYKWEIPGEEAHLKWELGDKEATYYPKGEMVYLPENADFSSNNILPCWKFDVYAQQPLYRAYLYVNATTGEVVFENHRLKDVDTLSTAQTSYSGVQTITTDYFTNGQFRLRETSRGNGIQTFDMLNGTNHGAAVDIVNDSIYWKDTLRAEYATDAHYGAEKVYDYYFNVHGRNSIDDNGVIMRSYVHYGTNYANAFWDGQRMTYGDGNSNVSALTTLDIAGHEITHGVDQYTSDLIYSYESGALDESFADIFGNTVEAMYKPNPINNWLVGEEIGSTLRSMSNPKARFDPDTYLGTYWYTGAGDNGGVHTNSGVQNHWFYILSEGASGTNDNNDTYNVTGIGIPKAEQIAYRNRAYYLVSTSDYEDARFYSIQSAYDIYGPCTPELASTVGAWYAVGVGDDYNPSVESDFEASVTNICFLPATVHFENLSNYNSVSYTWEFGDGTTDTSKNPVHTYAQAGTYSVKLTAVGNSMCGSDVKNRANYINVNPPADAQVSPYSICDGYEARITANVQNRAYWYADSSSTQPIYVGNPFVSPKLYKDTMFYCANGIEAPTQSLGPSDNSFGGGSNFSNYRYLTFDVFEDVTIKSVKVYSFSNTQRIIELRDALGTVLQSKTVNVPAGEEVIDLDFAVGPGTDYQLGVNYNTPADFYRNNSGASYPYTINGLISITKPGNAPPSYYYFFYDWKIKGRDCIGQRYPVPVTIDFDPDCVPYVGIEEKSTSNDISVYPNPSNGNFNLSVDMVKDDMLNIRLMDAKGQMVMARRNVKVEEGQNVLTFNEAGLSKGFYLLQIMGENMNESKRIIIE